MLKIIVLCHSENNALHYLKKVSFVKRVPVFEHPENAPTLIVLHNLMDSAYSTKVSELFTIGSHRRNSSNYTKLISPKSVTRYFSYL